MVVTIHEAKTHLSRLIQRVLDGESVIIAKGATPVVELRKLEATDRRVAGRHRGRIRIAPDFDAPLEEFSEYGG